LVDYIRSPVMTYQDELRLKGNKRERKPNGAIKNDQSREMATLCTQDTGRKQTKTQHGKLTRGSVG